ncbi:MAG TPA: hypothetical protein VLW55_22150, partial [Burkholderiaceae bacterium]|nr:hypothetical protein [Burkholderiaceae bacterium]
MKSVRIALSDSADAGPKVGAITMPIQISPLISARTRGNGSFSVKTIDLEALGQRASPIALLDDFRVRGQPFGPHPHAGFSAVTYVLEDSQGSLRSRDSL